MKNEKKRPNAQPQRLSYKLKITPTAKHRSEVMALVTAAPAHLPFCPRGCRKNKNEKRASIDP